MKRARTDPHFKSQAVFLVLSEDSARSAVDTIEALTRTMCGRIPTANLHQMKFDPPDPRQRQILAGNKWKSNSPVDQPAITDLVRTIAAHLRRADGFVIFHFDGDRPYAQRANAENPRKFQKQIAEKVRNLLATPPVRKDTVDSPAAAVAPADPLEKLFLFTPYYSIEAWTYYNTEGLLARCPAHEHAKITRWASDPHQLEETHKVAEELSIGKKYNQELAEQAFPTEVAIAAGKSFADTVHKLKENGPLLTALSASRTQR
jgi:hypothetical protein